MNGALNNASMALELALGDNRDSTSEQTLEAGVAAIARASRAAALLAHIVNGRGAPPGQDDAYARDVREILQEQARAMGRAVPADLSEARAGQNGGAPEAAERLVQEIARMQPRR